MDTLAIFIFLSGFVIGLGSVTVIDLHGFLGRKSKYWTVATTRTHKITKPLIWLGTVLAILGGSLVYRNELFAGIPLLSSLIAFVLVANGLFLTNKVSPFLLEREKVGKDGEILPRNWQRKITVSFLISFLGWWGALLLFAIYISSQL